MLRRWAALGDGIAPTIIKTSSKRTYPNWGTDRASHLWMARPFDATWQAGAPAPPNAAHFRDIYPLFYSLQNCPNVAFLAFQALYAKKPTSLWFHLLMLWRNLTTNRQMKWKIARFQSIHAVGTYKLLNLSKSFCCKVFGFIWRMLRFSDLFANKLRLLTLFLQGKLPSFPTWFF